MTPQSLSPEECAVHFDLMAATSDKPDAKKALRFCARFVRSYCSLRENPSASARETLLGMGVSISGRGDLVLDENCDKDFTYKAGYPVVDINASGYARFTLAEMEAIASWMRAHGAAESANPDTLTGDNPPA